jgi:hypothetical protein
MSDTNDDLVARATARLANKRPQHDPALERAAKPVLEWRVIHNGFNLQLQFNREVRAITLDCDAAEQIAGQLLAQSAAVRQTLERATKGRRA